MASHENDTESLDDGSNREIFKVEPLVFLLLIRGVTGVNEEILLLERKTGTHSLPAGHIEEGEEPQDAAVRELREEVGVSTKPENMNFIHTGYFINTAQRRQGAAFFFQPKSWEGEPVNQEPDEHEGLGWYPVDNLPVTLVPQTRACLQSISLGQPITVYRS